MRSFFRLQHSLFVLPTAIALLSTAFLAARTEAGRFEQPLEVFRHLDSHYSSGHATRSALEAHLTHLTKTSWSQVRWQGISYWTPTEDLLDALSFSRRAELQSGAPLRQHANLIAPVHAQNPKQQQVLVQEDRGTWARVLTPQHTKPLWTPKVFLQPPKQLKVTQSLSLRAHQGAILYHSTAKQKILTVLPAGTRLQPLQWRKQGVTVRRGSEQGFVLYEQLLTPFPLAKKVRSLTQSSYTVHEVRHGFFVVSKQRKLPLKQTLDIELQNQVALAGAGGARLYRQPRFAGPIKTLPAGQKLPIQGIENQLWAKSSIAHIGQVWWQKPRQQRQAPALASSTLFRQPVFDMVRSPKDKALVLASAGGIFRSQDGQSWQELRFFKGQDYPLAAAANGHLYAGPYLSRDNGQTFQTFIHWERLLPLIQARQKSQRKILFNQVKVLWLNPLSEDGRKVSVTLKAAGGVYRLLTTDLGRSWQLL